MEVAASIPKSTHYSSVCSGKSEEKSQEDSSQEIHNWVLNGKEVKVFLHNTELGYKIIDIGTNHVEREGLFEEDSYPIEQKISYLKKCIPVIYNDRPPSFSKPNIQCKWNTFDETGDVELHLIENQSKATWEVFNKRLNLTHWIPFENIDVERPAIMEPFYVGIINHAEAQYDQLKYIKRRSLAGRVSMEDAKSFIRDCTVKSVSIEKKMVFLEPITALSRIDSTCIVTRFCWAVTLICAEPAEGRNGKSDGCHAEIIIEGVRNGKYFMDMADLNGEGYARKHDFIEVELRFSQRTKIWEVSSAKVSTMIDEIKEDEEKSPLKFNRHGRDSLITSDEIDNILSFDSLLIPLNMTFRLFTGNGGDSCITWAKRKLEILDIDLGRSPSRLIVTIPKYFTELDEEHKASRAAYQNFYKESRFYLDLNLAKMKIKRILREALGKDNT